MAFNLRPDKQQQIQIEELKTYLNAGTNSSAIFMAVDQHIKLKGIEEQQKIRIMELERSYSSVLALLKRQVALQNEVASLVG